MRRRGDKLGKVQFSELQKPHDFGLDLGSGHTAYHRALLIDLYLRTKFHIEIGKTFLWTDGGTDVPTDGHF